MNYFCANKQLVCDCVGGLKELNNNTKVVECDGLCEVHRSKNKKKKKVQRFNG
eukprot:m.3236 g.3236  ORF g.3236 m.3236 type:complete len:53 (+) comp3328_c0_seq1:57-215(+)